MGALRASLVCFSFVHQRLRFLRAGRFLRLSEINTRGAARRTFRIVYLVSNERVTKAFNFQNQYNNNLIIFSIPEVFNMGVCDPKSIQGGGAGGSCICDVETKEYELQCS